MEDREGRIGWWVSGSAHTALILWAILGGVFLRPQPPTSLRTTEVATMSGAEFEALAAASRGAGPVGRDATAIATMPAPAVDEDMAQAPEAASLPDAEDAAQDLAQPDRPEARPDLSDFARPDPVAVATDLGAPAGNQTEDDAAPLPPADSALPTSDAQPARPQAPDTDQAAQPVAPRSELALDRSALPRLRPEGLVEQRNARLAQQEAERQAAAQAARAAEEAATAAAAAAEAEAEARRLTAEREAAEEARRAQQAAAEEAERQAEQQRQAEAAREAAEEQRQAQERREAAEQAEREAQERREAEAEREAEENRRAAEAAERERVEAERRESEAREAERLAEEERQSAERRAEEQRRAEAERQAEEQRQVEEDRRAAAEAAAREAEERRAAAERDAREQAAQAARQQQQALEDALREAQGGSTGTQGTDTALTGDTAGGGSQMIDGGSGASVTQDPLAAALAGAMSGQGTTGSQTDTGVAEPMQLAPSAIRPTPLDGIDMSGLSQAEPLSLAEKDSFRTALRQCWNEGALSVEASQMTVSVAFSMTADGRPIEASLRIADYRGGSEAGATHAFDVARRAIMMCGGVGFPLPFEKYGRWRDVVVEFRPGGIGFD